VHEGIVAVLFFVVPVAVGVLMGAVTHRIWRQHRCPVRFGG
jgi:hypothetical protein